MLKIEVIRFEAEDVITASVEAPVVPEQKPVECICSTATYDAHHPLVAGEDGGPIPDGNGWLRATDHSKEPACPASEHPNCVYQQVN